MRVVFSVISGMASGAAWSHDYIECGIRTQHVANSDPQEQIDRSAD